MAEPATLRFHWPARWYKAGTVVTMVIEVDGREVGRLRHGQSLVTQVESGRRNLWARTRDTRGVPLELILAPGEDVHLETRISQSWISRARPSL